MELFAGVDIGSTTSKCVLLDERGEMLTFQVVMTEFDRNVSGSKALPRRWRPRESGRRT